MNGDRARLRSTRPIGGPDVFGRVAQFGRALRSRPDPRVDAELRALLGNEAQWRLLERLTPFDRAHHLSVRGLLVTWGHDDPDLLRAALLHDVGKADEHGRVRLPHRVALVLWRALRPWRRGRPGRAPGSRVSHGMQLAVRHAELGARLAAEAGASPRCCELIAAHEGVAGGDAQLAALVAADSLARA